MMVKFLGIVVLVYFVTTTFASAATKIISISSISDIVITFLAMTVVLLVPIWIGLFFVKMFPSFRITKDGVKCSSVGPLKDLIRWNEIEELIMFENGYIAMAFHRSGFFLLNGLYYNKLYAMIVKHEGAVLYISPSTESRDEILNAIFNHAGIKPIKKFKRR